MLRNAGVTLAGALAVLAILSACRRGFESPYLPGDPGYAGDDWTGDADGDGVADSLEKYAPDCRLPPKQCLDQAKAISGIGDQRNTLTARDMLIWLGDSARAPNLEWKPAEASLRGYILASSDSGRVRPLNGKLLPVALGSAQILVKVPGADSLATSFVAKVVSGGPRVESVTAKDLSIAVGADTLPELAWVPANALYREYYLDSDKPEAALVVGQKVRGIAPGKATLTLSTQDGGHMAVFSVTVQAPSQEVALTSLTARNFAMKLGDAPREADIGYVPANATDKAVTLKSSSGSAVIGITSQNKVAAIAPGKALLTIVSNGNAGIAVTCTVTVTAPVKSLSARNDTLRMGAAEKDAAPDLAWTPANASDTGFTLAYANANASPAPSSIVTLVGGTRMRPAGPGTASLVAISTDNPSAKDTFTVTVIQPVASLTAAPVSIKVGDPDKEAAVTVAPANASDKGYTLASGAPAVATVVAGKIHAVGPGTAVFTATSAADAGKTATFTVTVAVPVISLGVDEMFLKRAEGDKDPVILWNPADATNKGYALGGGDPAVATVVANRIHPVGTGNATFTVTSADGGKQAAFQVNVTVALEAVSGEDISMGRLDPDQAPQIHFTPADASNKGYTLHSSNPEVASIVNGKINAVSRGTADITIISADNPAITGVFQVRVSNL